MRMLTGQAIADEGEITVLGHELPGESKEARAQMGVVPQLDNLDVDVTVEDNLAVFARLYRVKDVRAAVDRGLALARLDGRRHDPVDELSGGMRRRLLLARGLTHDPPLLLLDEPTVGLDPQIRTELWSLIDSLRTKGTTILMSTHYIEEAERLADEVALMTHGKIISRGKPSELVAQHAGRETAEVYAPPERLAEVRAKAEAAGAEGAPRRAGDRDRGRREGHRTAWCRRRRSGARRRSRTCSCCSPGRRRSEARLEPAAIGGVMSREVANFRTFWKATTFSSVLEPVIYLLAFGLGLGATLVNRVDGLELRRVRRHRHGRDGGDLLERVAGDVRHVREGALPAHLRRDPRGARRRGGARDGRDALDRPALGLLRLLPAARVDALRARPGAGDAARARSSASSPRSASPAFGIAVAASVAKIDQFNYVTTLFITPLFLVAGTFFPIDQLPEGRADRRPAEPALPSGRAGAPRLLRLRGTDLLRVAVLIGFAVVMWRVAVNRMEKRLID